MSYKAAWQALETLTNLAGVPLVEKVVGRHRRRRAELTPAGQRVQGRPTRWPLRASRC